MKRELVKLVEGVTDAPPEIKRRFSHRIFRRELSRDEDPISHFGVYFLPIDPGLKQIFLVHHKKSNLWLSPGGHMEKNELPRETLIREAMEELGLRIQPSEINPPFLLTITPINNAGYACREHFDIWYLIKIKRKGDVLVNLSEFHNSEWLDISQAQKIVTDANNLRALKIILKSFD